jgi:CheY-specific phosphatase CheX
MDIYAPENPAFATMANHLVGAVHELFDAYGSAVVLSPSVETSTAGEQDAMAVIGYAGKGLRGALILLATEATVCAWMTAAGLPDGDVADTLGEFSNMLLGRLKARILREGISIIATTPTSMTGAGLRLSDPSGRCAWSAFDGPGWHLNVRLDAEFELGFEPDLCRRVSHPAQAGDFLEF